MKYKNPIKGFVCFAIIIFTIFLMTFSTAFAYSAAYEPKLPKPTTEFYCNDFADVLNSSIEQDIVRLGERTKNVTDGGQIVFVSVKSLEGNTIEEYANTLFNNWKIGTKDKGVLFILSMEERRSRIEVGYGYEGTLTDLETYKLLEKFSSINQEEGLNKAVFTIYSDICKIVSGEEYDLNYKGSYDYNSQNNYSRNGSSNTKNQQIIKFILEHPIVLLLFVILIILDLILTRGRITRFIFRMMASGSRRGGRGGGWGGGGNSGGGGRSGGGGSSSRF